MAIEWSPDYCLTCDRQCPAGAAYCSPSCKLADTYEFDSTSSSPSVASSSAPLAPSTGFYLPPALNFSAMTPYSSSSPSTRSPLLTTTPSPPPTNLNHPSRTRSGSQQQQQQQQLFSSPSRTSLSSLPTQYGSHESGYLSDKAAKELRDYENAFDQVRGWKRRMTVTGC